MQESHHQQEWLLLFLSPLYFQLEAKPQDPKAAAVFFWVGVATFHVSAVFS